MKNNADYQYTAPNVGWIVGANDNVSDQDQLIIDLLYQPIIGVVATSLIHYFWHHYMLSEGHDHQIPHAELMHFLQIDQRLFYQARLKLEGVGLLRTYVQNTAAHPFIIYQLVLPMSARQFFDDDLLTITLLENVGEEQYHHLNHQLVPSANQLLNGANEISHDFLSVFRVNRQDLIQTPDAVKGVKQRLDVATDNNEKEPTDDGSNSDFDFAFLTQILDKSYVDIKQVKKYRSLINSLNQLFGVDELQMSKLIIRSTNVNNNVFDPDKLRLLVHRQFIKLNTTASEDIKASADEINQLSSESQALLRAAEEMSPIEFSQTLKQQKDAHAYLTKDENKIIESFVMEHLLPSSVLNILIFHMYNDLDFSTLNPKIMDKISNEWLQKYHVKNAAEAIRAIQEYNQAVKKRSAGNVKYRKNNQKDVQVPDWMNEKYDPEQDRISAEKKAQLAKKLANLKKER